MSYEFKVGDQVIGRRGSRESNPVIKGVICEIADDSDGLTLYVDNGESWIYADNATLLGPNHEVLEVDIPEEPPAGSVVLDANGTAWQKQPDRWVKCSTLESFSTALPWAYLVAESRKLTVIYRTPGGEDITDG